MWNGYNLERVVRGRRRKQKNGRCGKKWEQSEAIKKMMAALTARGKSEPEPLVDGAESCKVCQARTRLRGALAPCRRPVAGGGFFCSGN